MNGKKFSDLLRAKMDELKLSVRTLARRLEAMNNGTYAEQNVYRLLNAEDVTVKPATVHMYANALNVPASLFFDADKQEGHTVQVEVQQ